MGMGFNDQTIVALGYAFEKVNVSLGGSVAAYYMPLCGPKYCGPVRGISLGGHARVDYYAVGPLGITTNVDVAWYGGRGSQILPGALAVTVTVGPILRVFWERK
jgi:hypothetical protein